MANIVKTIEALQRSISDISIPTDQIVSKGPLSTSTRSGLKKRGGIFISLIEAIQTWLTDGTIVQPAPTVAATLPTTVLVSDASGAFKTYPIVSAADDTAAGVAGVSVGGIYWNSTNSEIQAKLT